VLTHDDILAALEVAFPRSRTAGRPDGVFLVARLREPELETSDASAYVFIPDTHLVPTADAERFGWTTAQAPQIDGLTRLAELLADLRARDSSLRVWQLGDFCDVWRTGDLGGAAAADADSMVADRRALVESLRLGAGMDVLIGNHDEDLLSYLWPGNRPAFKTVVLDKADGAGDTILAHGHQFDPIETLPRDVKEFFARGFTERVPPAALGMLEATNPHWKPQPVNAPPPKKPKGRTHFLNFDLTRSDPLPLGSDEVNVLEHTVLHDPSTAFVNSLGGGTKPSVDGPRQTFFSDAAFWADETSIDGRDVRLIVIGHTHQARIVRGERKDGTRFVLVDCGAWVGLNFLSNTLDAPIANAQIGVKVGDDLRIYQLGYAPRV
jgi:UDP-2,3-diacylglucosamine pyrophosphatase LpxH